MMSGRECVMSRSPSKIRPSVGRYSPVSMLNSVVFPAPFGPINDTMECCGTSNETSLTATRPPNIFVTCSARRTLTAAAGGAGGVGVSVELTSHPPRRPGSPRAGRPPRRSRRSEEHTSELQSQFHLVCRLLLEKKKTPNKQEQVNNKQTKKKQTDNKTTHP